MTGTRQATRNHRHQPSGTVWRGSAATQCDSVLEILRAPARQPARGMSQNGKISFLGTPSPSLLGHEVVHAAQQHLGSVTGGASPRGQLEAEAARLGPRVANGEPVRIGLPAVPQQPLYGSDPDKTYTSTVGLVTDDEYIKAAHEFHQKWGYKPINAASLEEITEDLAKGTGKLARIRIVSHASQIALYMQFAKGGPDAVLEEELNATTQTEAEQAGVDFTADYSNDEAKKQFRDGIISSDSKLAKRLGITSESISNTYVDQLFRWLVNRHRLTQVPGVTAAERNLILPAVNRQVNAAKVVAKSNGGGSDEDLQALEKFVTDHVFSWSALGDNDGLKETLDRASSTHGAFASRDFALKQSRMRGRFDENSVIEVRGCALGQSKNYMEAVQNYFGGAGGKPGVTAPKWYQYFGRIKLLRIPDDDRQIMLRWSKWKGVAPIYEPASRSGRRYSLREQSYRINQTGMTSPPT